MAVKQETQINQAIRDPEVRVVGANGEQLGIMSSREANEIAEREGLDLVKISPSAVPPVCKIFLIRQKEKKNNAKIKRLLSLKKFSFQ